MIHCRSHRRCRYLLMALSTTALLEIRNVEAFHPVLKSSSSLLSTLPSSSVLVLPPPSQLKADGVLASSSSTALASSSGGGTRKTATQEKSPGQVSAYYLVWSPKFLPKFLAGSIFLAAYHLAIRPMMRAIFAFQNPLAGLQLGAFSNNFILPMLSSSCCLIQLIITNVLFVGGCAGFNTYLGPIRPYFLALLAYLTTLSSPTATPRFAMTLLFRLTLAMLPELVHVWNIARPFSSATKSSSAQPASAAADLGSIRANIQLAIPTMGCVACINNIDSSLRAPKQVIDAKSWLSGGNEKGGKATVQVGVNSMDELKDIENIVVKAVHKAGFGEGCEVESVEVAEEQ